MQKIFRMLLFNFHGLLTQTVYNPNCQTDHIMQAECHSLSKETPQNFQHLREVVGNYFHNGARFVIFQLDPSNYQIAFQGIP